jgi:hypothetical protein
MTPEEKFAAFKRAEFEAAQKVIDKVYAVMAAACREKDSGQMDEATFAREMKRAEWILEFMTRKRRWE